MELVTVAWLAIVAGVAGVAYPYVGYPALLALIAGPRERPTEDEFTEWPAVTMVVAAHNEAGVIEAKLANTAAIDYPGQFDCLVVSDSTDETDDVVRSHGGERVRLLELSERRGKSHALNRAVDATDSDILVFSDANTMYEADAVRHLVGPLVDSAVGCTTGQLRLTDPGGETSESAYWRYELWLRRLEARFGTTVSINGGCLALRRADFEPLPENALTDDFVVALQQLAAHRRVVYVPEARTTEETTGGLWSEFDRRVRIGAGNYQTLGWFAGTLHPRYGITAVQFLSHKVCRWLVPGLLLAIVGLTAGLVLVAPSTAAVALAAVELSAAAVALVGAASSRARRLAAFRLPAYVLVMQLAFAVGFVRFLRGPTTDIWGSTRS